MTQTPPFASDPSQPVPQQPEPTPRGNAAPGAASGGAEQVGSNPPAPSSFDQSYGDPSYADNLRAGASTDTPYGGQYQGGQYAGGRYQGAQYQGGQYAGGQYQGGQHAGSHSASTPAPETSPFAPAGQGQLGYGQASGAEPTAVFSVPPSADHGGIPPHTPYAAYVASASTPPPSHPTRRRGLAALVAAACLAAGATGGAVGFALADDGTTPVARTSPGSLSGASTASTGNGTVAGAAATIIPSTVVIEVRGNTGGRLGQETGGSGSGVVLDTEGNILTNAHVVTAGGTVSNPEIQVVLSDGTTVEATVVGMDESSDLAVINIEGVDGLTPASFADSDELTIGQTVVAVGAPLGLSGTVTEGIVSSVDRPVRTGSSQDASTVLDAVQTDAAINPGNSGGPLVDLDGSVVGINSAIATVSSSSGESGNIGVGFAIPSNDAVDVADQLIADGTAEHPSLGVSVGESEDGSGALIAAVERGSAAAQAGMQEGDVVTAVGDRPVRDLDGLLAAIRDHQPGDQVAITVLRDDQEETLTVTLGSRAG